MEILNEVSYVAAHLILIVLLVGGAVLTFFLFFYTVKEINLGLSAIVFVVGASFAIEAVAVINDGPCVEYEAYVTDYNEVYEQGYEVVKNRGDITVLKDSGKGCS